jgi:transcriptional regulator of arginine metabolism
MNLKKDRLIAIRNIIREQAVESQEELLNILKSKGFEATQATLSRDMKQLKIIKSPDAGGKYVYTLSKENNYTNIPDGFATIEFSGQLAVIKTRPGYASAIASDIDTKARHEIMGTIAGDDTILIIPREGITRKEIIEVLSNFITIEARRT